MLSVDKLTLINSTVEKDLVDELLETYEVANRDALCYFDTSDDIVDVYSHMCSKTDFAGVISFVDIRLIYTITDAASAEQFVLAYDKLNDMCKCGHLNACSIYIIWEIDNCKMPEVWRKLSRCFERTNNTFINIKCTILSQLTEDGVVFRDIDREIAAVVAVLSACGRMDNGWGCIHTIGKRELTIDEKDINNIIESKLIDRAKKLIEGKCIDDNELWKKLFGKLTKVTNGCTLADICISFESELLKKNLTLPRAEYICAFIPTSQNDINDAIEYFRDNNTNAIADNIKNVLAAWENESEKVFSSNCGIGSTQALEYLNKLAYERIDEESLLMQFSDTSASALKFSPSILTSKVEKELLTELYEQACGCIKNFKKQVALGLIKGIQASIRDKWLHRAEQMISVNNEMAEASREHGTMTYDQIGHFAGISNECKDIVNNIANLVSNALNEEHINDASDLSATIKDCFGHVRRQLPTKDMIGVLNSKAPVEIIHIGALIGRSTMLLRPGYVVKATPNSLRTFAFISRFLKPEAAKAVLDVLHIAVDSDGYSIPQASAFNNILAIDEYTLGFDSENGLLPDTNEVVPRLLAYTDGVNIARNDEPKSANRGVQAQYCVLYDEVATEQNVVVAGTRVVEYDDKWRIENPKWQEKTSIPIVVKITGKNKKGVVREEIYTPKVGALTSVYADIKKDGWYGKCSITVDDNLINDSLMGNRLKVRYSLKMCWKKIIVKNVHDDTVLKRMYVKFDENETKISELVVMFKSIKYLINSKKNGYFYGTDDVRIAAKENTTFDLIQE